MKYLQVLLLALCAYTGAFAQHLKMVDQNYKQALNLALQENKLVLIDFYTTWCVPCKKLDRLVFQNDSVQQLLGKDFILLRYNAENDSVFNLSKKHHIFIYPSAVVLNKNGYVVNRNYGFSGEDFSSLSKSVFEFTGQSLQINRENSFIKGYSNTIDMNAYPKFYIDYVNRTNTKPAPADIKKYFDEQQHNLLKEGYFSTLLQFGSENVPSTVIDSVLVNKDKFIELYGKKDIDALLYIFARSKFDNAIEKKNQADFDDAILFVVKTLDMNYASTIQYFKTDFLQAQGKWNEVLKVNQDLKNKGEFSDEAVNNFCWEVYKKCDDRQVIEQCISWMKELTVRRPEYAYLDTYAFLSYKSGNAVETKKIVQLAIEAARKEKENSKNLENLLKKL
ncbi:thioredoxin family protein [Ferruginibacter sp. HRS2-29]|uniref:thioredoxin family protein n=1 Tax=Ferruginibacter sp. HRS2-29 TaxID=2487334 RepID=UPI0020CE5F16|nr:thioredoxin family protein [Ferruginibacter sp. HRS2-29]MCP9753436.1 hypothetical protein [Ferruginibacter sp. HRS2-29]